MSEDISPILRDWPWDPVKNVRRVTGEDGHERIQIRVCLNTYHGILQFECDGRPDGERPHRSEFALDHYEASAREDPEFRLDAGQAAELFEEGMMVYQRYAVLLQLGDFERVIRDTARNMRLFRFVNAQAQREEDRGSLEKWWPYVLRVHFTARGMVCLQKRDAEGALHEVQTAMDQIEALTPLEDEVFVFERKRSLEALTELKRRIQKRRPLSEIEVLERMKDRAVAREDYELAAQLHHQIAQLQAEHGGTTNLPLPEA